jgi:hypothetical protein
MKVVLEEEVPMRRIFSRERGKIGWLLLWLLGVPVPVLLILFLIRGCT